MGLLDKLQSSLPRAALITIYKAFVIPHLDYGDVLYDQSFNTSFHEKLGFVQYSACLALAGAIRGTSKEKVYQELSHFKSADDTETFVSFMRSTRISVLFTYMI